MMDKEKTAVSSEKEPGKKVRIKDILMLEAVFLIYSASSVVSKIASGNEVISFKFFLFYALEVAILGVYALLWQQVIKRFELSVAYANKAVTLIWALIWSVVLFREEIKLSQIIGVLIVMVGIYILNSDKKEEKE